MSWQNLLKKGLQGFEKGDYTEAENTLTEAMQSLPAEVSRTDRVKLMIGLGRALTARCKYDEAKKNLEDAVSLCRNDTESSSNANDETDPANLAIALCHLGVVFKDLHELKRAEEVLNEGLAIAIDFHGESHPTVGETLNNLGLVYWRKGADNEAIDYFSRALAALESSEGKEHPRYAETMDNLGIIHQRIGNFSKAIELHQSSLELREKLLGDEHPDVSFALLNLATAKAKAGDDTEYENLAQRALKISKKAFGENSDQVATALGNLGTYYLKNLDMEKALEHHKQALEIKERIYGEDSPRLATSISNICATLELSDYQGNSKESEAYSSRAERIIEKLFEEEGGRNIDTVLLLADRKVKNKDIEGADRLLTKALITAREEFGMESPKAAVILEFLGAVHSDMRSENGDREKAKDVLFEALRILKKENGNNSSKLPKVLRMLSNCFALSGDMTTGQVLESQARAIDFKLGLKDPAQDAFLKFMEKSAAAKGGDKVPDAVILSMMRMRGDETADEFEQNMVDKAAEELGENSPKFAEKLISMAMSNGDQEKTLEYYEKAISIYLSQPEKDLRRVSSVINLMVSPCMMLHSFEKMEEWASRLHEETKKKYGDKHWKLRLSLQQVAQSAQLKGDLEEVSRIQKDIEALPAPTKEQEEKEKEESEAFFQALIQESLGSMSSIFGGLEELGALATGIGADGEDSEGEDIVDPLLGLL